jgi:hypothetical protein
VNKSFHPQISPALKALARPLVAVFFIFCLLMADGSARAQLSGTGAITGTVTDSTGAIVPNATVTATSNDTNVSTVRTTSSAGDYSITPLTPGEYTLTVKAPGFEKFVQEHITVNALNTTAVEAKLTVGSVDQTVTVTEAPPVLDTTNATLGGVMDNQMYSSLPLLMGAGGNADQRRATDFAALMPGVQNSYAASSSNNSTDATGAVNGGNPTGGTSEIYIDGLNLPEADGIGDPRFTWTAFSVDAINQFQVQTVGIGAQYAGQGIQNYSIKSGGNQIHGSLYEYLRNTVLDAWSPTAKTPTVVGVVPAGSACTSAALTASTNWCKLGGVKNPEIMNEFGMTISGPIIKNKLFLFGNYGQYRYASINKYQTQTLPTLAMLGLNSAGQSLGYADYSGWAAQAGTGAGIYDPATQTVNNCSGANCKRTQFANNQIPANRISTAASYVNQFLLKPEATVNQSLYTNNIVTTYPVGLNNWYESSRVDYSATPKQQLSFIIAFGRQSSTGPNSSGAANALPPPFNTSQAFTPVTTVDVAKYTYTLNSHMVNQAAIAFGRYESLSVTPSISAQYAASMTGLLNTPAGQASYFPGISFTGGSDVPNNEAGYDENKKTNNTYNVTDNFQWQLGAHNIQIGGQVVETQFNYTKNESFSSPLTYTFSNAQTEGYSGTGTALTNTGQSYASYMLGAVSSSSVSVGVPTLGTRWVDPSFWVQDDWKVNSRLTLNVGVRWDIYPSIHEAHNLFTWLNPTGQNVNCGCLGTLSFAGGSSSDGYHTGVSNPSPIWYKNIAPRLGLAFQADPKTVFRASYSLNFARGDWTSGSQSGSPSTLGLTPSASAAGGLSNAPSFYWDGTQCGSGTVAQDGFTPCGWTGSIAAPASTLPAGATLAEYAAVETATLKNANNGSPVYFDPYLGSRTPEYINWSFGFERQLTNDTSVSISYIGSQGHFLNVANAKWQTNDKLPESYAALAGYTLTSSNGATQTPCSGNTCLYPVLGQKGTPAYLALAAADGFTPPNGFSSTANYYNGNSVYPYYTNFPQYSGVTDTTSFVGNENWNALEVSIRQRPSHGLNWMVNYTWSKSIDDLGTFRVYDNTRLDRGISAASQPQNLVGTIVYALPLGKGHMFGDNPIYRAIVSGWNVSDIVSLHSGLPAVITGSGCGGSDILNTCTPNIVAGVQGRQHSYGKTSTGAKVNWDPSSPNYIGNVQYINPAAFTVNIAGTTSTYGTSSGQALSVGNGPALYVPGNAPRVGAADVWGQGYFDTDLGIKRSFPLFRQWALQFGADISNLTNHVVYTTPTGTVQSGSNTGFGTISKLNPNNNPREIQLSGRVSW